MEELDEPMLSDVSILRKVFCEQQSFLFYLGKPSVSQARVGWQNQSFASQKEIRFLGANCFLIGVLCSLLLGPSVRAGTCLSPHRSVGADGEVAGVNVE